MINITPANFDPLEVSVLRWAAAAWDQQLRPHVTINLYFEKTALPPGLLGLCIPNGVLSPQNGLVNCWYVSALADHISGADQQAGQYDAAIYIDSNQPWYLGEANRIGQNQRDFPTVALHEMGHAFGYVGLFSWNNTNGLYGWLIVQMLPPYVQQNLPFPFPNLNGWPSILGLKTITQRQGNPTLVTPGQQCPPLGLSQLGQDLVTPAFFQVQGGGTRAVYAPNAFVPFSSFDHLDGNTYPNALMQPYLPLGVAREIDTDSLAVLQSLGW